MGIHIPQFFSITPIEKTGRGQEIHEWLMNARQNDTVVEYDLYVIIDDMDDILPGQVLVKTDPAYGLSLSGYAQACRQLDLQERRFAVY
jgi:hypothetical protein